MANRCFITLFLKSELYKLILLHKFEGTLHVSYCLAHTWMMLSTLFKVIINFYINCQIRLYLELKI